MTRRGVTLIELMVAAMLIGLGVALMVHVIRILNAAMAQKAVVQARADGQMALIATTRDIRNAQSLSTVSPCQLTLRVFDFAKFGFDDPALFDPVNIGTMTLTYKNVGGTRYLEKLITYPTRTDTKKILTNMLDTCDGTNYMFRGVSSNGLPPFDAVEVVYRFRPTFIFTSTFSYTSTVMRRGQSS